MQDLHVGDALVGENEMHTELAPDIVVNPTIVAFVEQIVGVGDKNRFCRPSDCARRRHSRLPANISNKWSRYWKTAQMLI